MDTGRTAVLIVCLYLLNLQLFCSYELFERSNPIPTGPHKIETDETWSVFNLSNQNWARRSLEFHVTYDTTVRLYRSTQQQS